jgi:rfaE bifunctional protein nucleotidyltransferase chain/domain
MTRVMTCGCFDLLHEGHLKFLNWAAEYGHLSVLVDSDAMVRRRKGAGRPIQSASHRLNVLRALRTVDVALVMDDENEQAAVIERHKPNLFVKSGAWKEQGLPRYLAEACRRAGTEVVYGPHWADYSTTKLIERLTA